MTAVWDGVLRKTFMHAVHDGVSLDSRSVRASAVPAADAREKLDAERAQLEASLLVPA